MKHQQTMTPFLRSHRNDSHLVPADNAIIWSPIVIPVLYLLSPIYLLSSCMRGGEIGGKKGAVGGGGAIFEYAFHCFFSSFRPYCRINWGCVYTICPHHDILYKLTQLQLQRVR